MGGEGGEFKAEGFVNAAADAVAADGRLQDFFRDDDTKALVVFGVGGKNQAHQRGADGFAMLVGVADATTGMKTVFLGNHSVILAQKGGCRGSL